MMRATDVRIPRTPVRKIRRFDPSAFLAQAGVGRTIVDLKKKQIIFSQGDPGEPSFTSSTAKLGSA
jgi:hypothetical protein